MKQLSRLIDLFAWGTDASFYRMTPSKVLFPEDEKEMSDLLAEAYAKGEKITFRAAGTSLSGQSVTQDTLVVCGKSWEGYAVEAPAERITLQPGITGGRVNEILKTYGRKFGPDPASIASAMVGGIVANNSSGMSCGVWANSDKLLESVRMIWSDGTVLDTADPESRRNFAAKHPEVLDAILKLRDDVLSDSTLVARIRKKYSIKNVTGLNILPLVTFEDPFDILAHSLVGSEGTLAFLSSVTMRTLPIPRLKADAMIYFHDIVEAARAVVAMKHCSVAAAEMLDPLSLRSVGDTTGAGKVGDATGAGEAGNKTGTGETGDTTGAGEAARNPTTVVLTQVTADTEEELSAKINAVVGALEPFQTLTGVHFTTDPAESKRYWAIRSGIFPTVGGLRPEGTSCLIEDVAFPLEDLPEATDALAKLLERHGYEDACIYGHALDGNFHFIINQAFDTDAEVARYEALIRDVAALVVGKYDGSLKAEHGTGRNVAPFVEYEWGAEAWAVMKRLKAIFDPKGILGNGVIFNDDPRCFLSCLKPLPILPTRHSRINKCIECGFCEINCVSCGFSMSSRTRIAVRREIARLRSLGTDEAIAAAGTLEKQYAYAGEKTCAADGLCATSCPMGISVADLTHELREQSISAAAELGWKVAADHFPAVKSGIRGVLALSVAGRKVLGDKAMASLCKGLHVALGVPLWTPAFPGPYRIRTDSRMTGPYRIRTDSRMTGPERPKVVYFPSCFNQMMGAPKGFRSLPEETMALLERAGYDVILPADREKLCCGTIWESKGMPEVAEKKVRELEGRLMEASCGGKYPVLCDQSPCLHRMRQCITDLHLYEPAEFIWTFLRDRLDFTQTDEPVAVHLTCSSRLMGVDRYMVDLARLCSTNVLIPEGVGCCGFAGDKGMQHPELNEWALRKLRPQIEAAGVKTGYSNSRTCEIGLMTNSGVPYVSIVYLVSAHTATGSHTD